MPTRISGLTFLIFLALLSGVPTRAAEPSFADLLDRAGAELAAGRRWEPPGDNLADTIMTLFKLAPTATPQQLAAFADLLERDRKLEQADHPEQPPSPVEPPAAIAALPPEHPAAAPVPPKAPARSAPLSRPRSAPALAPIARSADAHAAELYARGKAAKRMATFPARGGFTRAPPNAAVPQPHWRWVACMIRPSSAARCWAASIPIPGWPASGISAPLIWATGGYSTAPGPDQEVTMYRRSLLTALPAATLLTGAAPPPPVTIGIMGGEIDGTFMRIATDLTSVMNSDTLRVVPIVGKGSLQNIGDLLHLPGVDLALVAADVLAYARAANLYPGELQKIQYICKLYDNDVHVCARPEIHALAELEGKPVNIDVEGAGTNLTARAIFATLGIKPDFRSEEPTVGQDKLRRGELAANVYVAGKPVRLLRPLRRARGCISCRLSRTRHWRRRICPAACLRTPTTRHWWRRARRLTPWGSAWRWRCSLGSPGWCGIATCSYSSIRFLPGSPSC